MRVHRCLLVPLLALALLPTASLGQGAAPRWQSRDELEAHSRELDRRVIELRHEIMAARHDGDAEALKRAEEELKSIQEKRVNTLQTLGHLP